VRSRVLGVGLAVLAGCSVGEGSGDVRGPMRIEECEVDTPLYDLRPSFFGGDFFDGSLIIRVAQGGETAEFSDEFVWRVNDTSYVAAHLNERIPVGPAGVAPVQATLRPNASCGRINISRYAPTVALEAMSGYVIFSSIYRGDPNADATLRLTEVTQFSIQLRDPRVVRDTDPSRPPSGPATREPPVLADSVGELEGWFRFYFVRGRPAQRFQ
jgi:hypothetical protein